MPVFLTPAGEYVGREHAGPKKKVADSRREFRRFLELAALEAAGRISGLRFQVPFKLRADGGGVVAVYVADFVYVENGFRVVEDAKGKPTPLYKLKRKWMLLQYEITIRET